MDTTVDVTIPIDAEVAQALDNPARREAAGRYLSGLLSGKNVCDILAEAITEAKQEAHSKGLTDDDVETELEAWRTERAE